MATDTEPRARHHRRHPLHRIATVIAAHWMIALGSHVIATILIVVFSHRLGTPVC